MRVSINNDYCIRNEKECSYIVCKDTQKNLKSETHPMVMPIPPIYGNILSFFSGNEMDSTIDEIVSVHHFRKETIVNFVNKIVENPNPYITTINNTKVWIPPFLLVNSNEKSDVATADNFHPYDKFIPKRPDCPFFLSLMITSKCQTNCIYCYADRHRKDDMDFEIISKIINEAKEENIPNLAISGGDILAAKNWNKILSLLISKGYPQTISTKIPLKREDILFLKENNINEVQISLDSLDDSHLASMVKVDKSYSMRIRETFKYAEELDFAIEIKSVLTKYNASKAAIKQMHNELSKYTCIKSWNIAPAFYSSCNISDYNEYKTDVNNLIVLLDFIKELDSPFLIEYHNIKAAIFTIQERYKTETEFIKKNKGCYANSYGLAIMANGYATICEMLYYNPQFYIGDTRKQSIKEIWNSSDALKLNFSGSTRKNNSPCYSCKEIDNCKRSNLKKSCMVDIVNTHGSNKWDYPDPRCPHSEIINAERLIY